MKNCSNIFLFLSRHIYRLSPGVSGVGDILRESSTKHLLMIPNRVGDYKIIHTAEATVQA